MVSLHFPSRSRSRARGRFPRAFAIALLGFQALLWGGGSIAEAQAAAESLSRHSHVEDQGATKCPPFHSHLDCVICRTLSSGATGASPTGLFVKTSLDANKPVSDEHVVADRGLPGTLGSRGPPHG